jgi:pyruvate dehydrogenase E1 component
MLHPGEKPKIPYLSETLSGEDGVFVAASDYMKALPCSVAKWIPGQLVPLGTDGFGRSDSRAALRDFFEVDARHITIAALSALAREGKIQPAVVKKAIKQLDIDPAPREKQ